MSSAITFVDFTPRASGERTSSVVFGHVVTVHVGDDYLDANGRFDVLKAQPVARLGGFNCLRVSELFELARPAKGG
jgi:flavin reductase (DIM6/NTAB) family NADH-FMN oxidoreductase RutF